MPDRASPPRRGDASPQPDAPFRVVARLSIAAAAAAFLSLLAWWQVPNGLELRTDVVGYPTFYDFDYVRYFAAFALVAVLFPVLAFTVHHLVASAGPLRRPPSGRPLLPIAEAPEPPPEGPPRRVAGPASALARLLLPGLVVAVEASAATSTRDLSLTAAGAAWGGCYVAAAGLGGVALAGLRRRRACPGLLGVLAALATVNSLAAPVTVLLLTAVSAATSVTVAGRHVVHYPWLPAWLAAFGALACEGYVLAARRRRPAGLASSRLVEGRLLAVVVGTIAVFLAISGLPGAQGPFDAFDPQELAGAQLVLVHGLLPWRDVLLLHGLLEDALDGAIGMALFSHSAWGAFAGIDLVVYPTSGCVFYLFVVYFARGNRLAALLAALVVIGGDTTAIMRFAYLPLVVVLFDKMLRSRRVAWASAFSLMLVLQCILVPEVGLLAIGLAVVVVLREVAGRSPGTALGAAFPLTFCCAAVGAASFLAFAGYLVATRSLGAFVDFYRLFGSDHALWGAKPVAWSLTGDVRVTVYFLLPVALLLGVVGRAVAMARCRRPFSSRDWSLLACASFVLLYYQKGLDRTDVSHVVEVYTVATPLVLLSGLVALDSAERLLARALSSLSAAAGRVAGLVAPARRPPRNRQSTPADVSADRHSPSAPAVRGAAPPPRRGVALAGLVVLLVVAPSVLTKVRDAPGAFHASAPQAPRLGRLGYEVAGDFDYPEVVTLGRLLDVYAGRSGPVFDFANEPVVTYFLLDRVPGSTFFHVESAETGAAQQLVVGQLEKSRPRVVIFTSEDYGLGLSYDDIPGMVRQWLVSEYLLEHYTPLADADGQLLMLRSDLVGKVPPVAALRLPGVSTTALYFAGQSCRWGDVPNFFPVPAAAARGVPATVSGGARVDYEVQGWAVDATHLRPAREVFAVSDGRVIGTARPALYRLDIEDYFKSPSVLYSGWSMDVDLPKGRRMQLYSLNENGTVSRLQPDPAPSWLASSPSTKWVVAPGGRRRRIFRGHWLPGWTNYLTPVTARLYRLELPAGASPATFSWLTLESGATLGGARYVLGDLPAETGHQVEFEAMRRGERSISVPVGSCLDWHGFGRSLDLVVYRSARRPSAGLRVVLSRAPPAS